MARIFYYTDDGRIYGVHPGPHEENRKIAIPSGVAWIDVPGDPNNIRWPQRDGLPGCEQWSRVIDDRLELLEKCPPLSRHQIAQCIDTQSISDTATRVAIEQLKALL